ncbi:uncharacterized protein LOC117582831 [Drosophila guanche]|uniref:DUF229 domain containing protein n=1 Tax=Drosophila guanche TaxID=7266 RepID=A0A3B0K466_DROGU|nr:uncharacterized protein LOC117582831 [Drosophila guanche]SPP80799.1 Hypothetical predicted protein [Drosophila guanche]
MGPPSLRPIHKWIVFCCLFVICVVFLPQQRTNDAPSPKFKALLPVTTTLDDSEDPNDSFPYSSIRVQDATALPLYFVESSQCKIPYVDPFGADTVAVYKRMVYEPCSNDTALVTPIYDVGRQRYVLHINETLATRLLQSREIEYNCYYQEIKRSPSDGYDSVDRKYFSQDYVVPLHVEALILGCHRIDNTSHILQSDAYTLVQFKAPQPGLSLEPSKRKPSLLMFGIDSLSRINLRRTMPKVYKFLTGRGWYELQGYNKIGDNTFPNLMAILAGYSPESAKEQVCDWKTNGCLDETPFIWKYFKNASYLTAYAEDESGINTFNYVKPGFNEQPTDYYLRPLQKAAESDLDTWKCADCSMRYCIGRRETSSYAYDLCKEFARRYVVEQPIWGLFWSNSFSHDDYRMPSKMEDYVLQYMLDLKSDGVLEQSIVIFLSDHGSRYGEIMYFESGFLESRLPSMFIYLPPWFRAQYPEYARALELNQHRLTSNYDLHNTLKHIIELGSPDGHPLPKSYDCPKCHSVFYPMDEQRTCEDAGIPEHYCTCVPYKRLSGDWPRRIAPRVIERINEYLSGRNLSSICANLSLSYIHETEIRVALDQNFHDLQSTSDTAVYRTMFKVKQNSADFRATVVFNNITEAVDVNVTSISRLDSYENDATCIADKTDKLYCICLSNLKE